MSFMDARDHGSKTGSGFVSAGQEATDRRERLRRLALETIDISKDPYIMRNSIGQIECRLCLTLHKNEGNYLAHTQGKRHQQNLAKRAAREALDKPILPAPQRRAPTRKTIKIGRPGYRITKQFNAESGNRCMLFQIEYPEIEHGERPYHRFMSAIEQKQEATNWKYQYVLFAADPYETIAFKIPNFEVDKSDKEHIFTHWDPDGKVYSLQVPFKKGQRATLAPPPPRQQQAFAGQQGYGGGGYHQQQHHGGGMMGSGANMVQIGAGRMPPPPPPGMIPPPPAPP